jgi:hypothetical protein
VEGEALQREKLVPSLPTRPLRKQNPSGVVRRGSGEEVDHTDDLPPVCFCHVTKAHARVNCFLVDRLGCRVISIVSAHREIKCTSRCVGATRGRLTGHPFANQVVKVMVEIFWKGQP